MREGMPAGHAINTVILGGNGSFDGKDILLFVLLDRLIQMRFERLAACCAQQVVIFQSNAVQDDIRGERSC